MLFADNLIAVKKIKEMIPPLFVTDTEAARTMLSSLIGGILSLTVFSFSMVMVVLNQASSNFSPRLLPGLISNKKHQIILGVYIGTLLYCITTLLFLGAYGIDKESMRISVSLGALFGFLCVLFFAYFIHNISTAIQIDQIVKKISKESRDALENRRRFDKEFRVTSLNRDTSNWQIIKSDTNGYFRGFHPKYLPKDYDAQENIIKVLPYEGQYIWKEEIIFRIKESIEKSKVKDVKKATIFSSDRLDRDDEISGLIKLMEVAVKAMSPGINDPGTALDAITKIFEIFHKILKFPPESIIKYDRNNIIVAKKRISTSALFSMILQPIRSYAKKDCVVMTMLIRSLQNLYENISVIPADKNAIENELKAIKIDIEQNIENTMDKQKILKQLLSP